MEFKIRGEIFKSSYQALCLFNSKHKEEIIKYSSLIIFAIVTLFLALNRAPFHDEAHSWLISKSFSFLELFKIEKYDGHLFIWHTLQMPFSKNDFFYPHSIYILNWLFCMGALFVMWRFAPFSNILKTLITFSYPFVWYFSQVARCYSIGILLIFILLALWKDKLKHPVIIPLLLITIANTSAMAIISAFSLGLIYIFDLFYNRTHTKNKIICFSVLMFGVVLVAIQLLRAGFPEINVAFYVPFKDKFTEFFFCYNFLSGFQDYFFKIIAIVCFMLYFFSIPYFYQKSKRALFYLLASLILMILLFTFKYSGSWWHYLFFYVNFIVAFWISEIENGEVYFKLKKIFFNLFLILLILFNIHTIIFKYSAPKDVYYSPVVKMVNMIKENNLFDGVDKIYTMEHFSSSSVGIAPYFPEYKFIDLYGNDTYGFEGVKNCNNRRFDKKDVDSIALTIDNNKKNIMAGQRDTDIIEGENWDIILTRIFFDSETKFSVYKIYSKRKS